MHFTQTPATLQKWEQTVAGMLSDACVSGNPRAARMALEQGAQVNVCTSVQAVSMLHLAAASNSPEVVRLLCAAHASTEVQDTEGKTPLGVALLHGHQQCTITLMLEGGSGVVHALQGSLSMWREAMLAILGACPNIPPESYVQVGQRLLAMQSDTEEFRRVLFRSIMHRYIGGIRLLLHARIDPNQQDPKSQRSALEVAEALLESELAGALRSFGAVEHRNPHFQEWALHLAAARGDRRCVTHWASRAELDWRDQLSGFITALMYAAAEGHRDIVWTLLDSHACAALYDAEGCTAADLARRRGHSVLADALEAISQSHVEELLIDFMRTVGSERAVHAVEEYRRPPIGDTIKNKTASTAVRKPIMQLKYETQVHQTHLHQPADSRMLLVSVVSGCNLPNGFMQATVDPWVRVIVGQEIQETTTHFNTATPQWNETKLFTVKIDKMEKAVIVCTVWDRDVTSITDNDLLGRLEVPLSPHLPRMLQGEAVCLTQPLNNTPSDSEPTLTLEMSLGPLVKEEPST